MGYNPGMIEVRATTVFDAWLRTLRSSTDRAIIAKRIARLARGLLGDVEPVGKGVLEMRIHHGPGYRIYFIRQGSTLVVLLCGGDKSSQGRDIIRAKEIAQELEG
jgi:putative addiction module killer protein